MKAIEHLLEVLIFNSRWLPCAAAAFVDTKLGE